jgi:phage terminase large subunit
MEIEIDEDVFNPIYYPFLDNHDRYNIFYGGSGSGKSVFSIGQRTVLECLEQSNNRFLMVRKVADTLRASVYQQVIDSMEEWNVSHLFKVNKTDMSIQGPNNNMIIMKGCDKVHKLKSITKINRLKIEEADELTEQEFNQLDLRVRGETNYQQISLHFNPVDEEHWIKKRFFDGHVNYKNKFNRYVVEEQNTISKKKVKVATSIIRSTYLDNKFAGEQYQIVLNNLKEIDPVYYQVYALAEWGVIKPDRPFADCFQKRKHVNNKAIYRPHLDIFLCWDFNINNTCLVIQHDDDNIYVLKEYHQTGWDLERICQEIVTDYPDATFMINGDASGNSGSAITKGNASAYDMLKQYLNLSWRSFNVPGVNPSHLNSRLLTNLILKKFNVYIHPDCKGLIRDLEKVYVDKKGSLDECKRKQPDLTHHLDPLRYHFHAQHYDKIKTYGLQDYIK